MTLERGQIIGYDVSRMAFEFTMIDKARTLARGWDNGARHRQVMTKPMT